MKANVRRALWKERVQHGWPVRQTGYWIRELRDDIVPPAAMELIPVSIKHADVSAAGPAILLRGAGGWSVEIPASQDAVWLANLLQRLA